MSFKKQTSLAIMFFSIGILVLDIIYGRRFGFIGMVVIPSICGYWASRSLRSLMAKEDKEKS